MKKILLAVVLVILAGATSQALPVREGQLERVPARTYAPRQDQCHLSYYNVCSGWAYYWIGYCWGGFETAPEPPAWGTCFDLSDCPSHCRHLGEVWFAAFRFNLRGVADVEIFGADANSCPTGSPIAGIYGYVGHASSWQHVDFGGAPLCSCEDEGEGKFVIMITQYCGPMMGCSFAPFSDVPPLNIEAGCETEWRCAGHSFAYSNVVSYCDVYGEPGPLWISGAGYGCTNYPTVPPGCHNYYYNTGCFAEWLIDCYISCLGPTATEDVSWSEIKALYR